MKTPVFLIQMSRWSARGPIQSAPIRLDGAAAVTVRDLSKTYAGGVRALDEVTFEVEPSSLSVFVGPNARAVR